MAEMSIVSYTVMPGGSPPPRGPDHLRDVGLSVLIAIVVVALGLALHVHVYFYAHRGGGIPAADAGGPPLTTSPVTAAAISGYASPYGKHGGSLVAGAPWGRTCEPIRLTVEEHVPDQVYAQVVAVVDQARRDGIDITMENRSFLWRPASLYYPAGVVPTSIPRVGVFASTSTPSRLPNGQPARLSLGWDTEFMAGGASEQLTSMQGELELASLHGNPRAERTAVRQLIALTQGIVATDRPGSGITTGTTLDAFSPADVAAMKAMSGCGDAASPTVAHTETGA